MVLPVPMVPLPLTELLGRADELRALRQLILDEQRRIITVTGPGGSGKTHLITELALQLGREFPDGAAFVGLAAVHDPDLVAAELARVLPVGDGADQDPIDRLVGALRYRRMLLVIDNFEHLVDAAPLLPVLSSRCPELVIVASSRRRLRVGGEHVFTLRALSLPPASGEVDHELRRYAAVELFCRRAAAIDPDFAPTPDTLAAIGEICRRVDGLPLAIELAAARSRLLAPVALLALLDKTSESGALDLLGRGPADAPARHDSVRACIAWSDHLLDPEARLILRKLSVLEPGFSFEAAEAVCAEASPEAGGRFLDILSDLVDAYLVEPVVAEVSPTPRFALLETVRLFASEGLADIADPAVTERRHAEHFLDMATSAAGDLESREAAETLERMDRELPNLRAALAWLAANGRWRDVLRAATALGPFWQERGQLVEGRRWLNWRVADDEAGAEAGLGSASDPDVVLQAVATAWSARLSIDHGPFRTTSQHRADVVAQLQAARTALADAGSEIDWVRVSHQLAYAYLFLEELDEAQAVVDEALAVTRRERYDWWTAELLYDLATSLYWRDDLTTASEVLGEASRLAGELGNQRLVLRAEERLGTITQALHGPLAGLEPLKRLLRLNQQAGNLRGTASNLANLAVLLAVEGDEAGATEHFLQAIIVGRENGYFYPMSYGIMGIVTRAMRSGDLVAAARLHGAMTPYLELLGRAVPPPYFTSYQRAMANLRERLGAAAFEASCEAGLKLPFSAAIDEAVAVARTLIAATRPSDAHPETPPPPATPHEPSAVPSGVAGLTDRQVEVLRLIGAGHTNREIADLLFLSPKTVMHHSGHIYLRLGVRGRAEAAAFAAQHGVL